MSTANKPAAFRGATHRVRRAPVVHKFGGAALAGSCAISRVAGLLQLHASRPSVVVVSAMSGVTDALAALSSADRNGTVEVLKPLADLHATHAAAVVAATCEVERRVVLREIEQEFEELSRVVLSAGLRRALHPHEEARILSLGERLSARLLVATLRSRGVAAEFVNAAGVVATSEGPLNALPDVNGSRAIAGKAIYPLLARGVMPVVPGFMGAAPDGTVTTLGRGGSDLSATLLATALGAREVTLWKDVPGLLTADPRVVSDARLLKEVNVDEAAELSRHGSRLIHPTALAVLDSKARVRVRPFGNPLHEGTVISARGPDATQPVKAITALHELCILTVRGGPMERSVSTIAFGAVATSGLWFAPVAASAADDGARILVRAADQAEAVECIRQSAALLQPYQADAVKVVVYSAVAAIGIVGPGIGSRGSVAVKALQALADAEVEVLASGMSRGRHSMTAIVNEHDAGTAQRALHAAFELHLSSGGRMAKPRHRDVLLVGVGSIGRMLLTQVAHMSDRIGICGVADSTGYLFSAAGLTRRQLARVVTLKESGGSLIEMPHARAGDGLDALRESSRYSLSRPVLVDATAADTNALLREAMAHGWDIVLANKLPLAGSQQSANELQALLRSGSSELRFEATVGAGLPVIDTVHRLRRSGDTIRRIEGCPSGTLGFVFGELERGSSFSTAVKTALDRGLTEPDPRDDLSGLDVARKALILGRLLGFCGDLEDVAVESLVPTQLLALSTEEFFRRLPELDDHWAARVKCAQARGRVLRYRVRVSRRRVTVGLVAVSASESPGRLSGTDNQFTFTTTRYSEHPLVITGPGAGAAVTAAGVLADLLQLDSTETWP